MNVQIDLLTKDHWEQIETIYRLGIETGNSTFETTTPGWESWKNNPDLSCSLVLMKTHPLQTIGWASISKVSSRCVYKGVGDVSIYLHPDYHGKGLGKKLLETLIDHSEKKGYWTLQSGIFPENKASIHTHKSCGFREVGIREKIGKHKGIWRDVLFMERRSQKF
ncbi:GNAT family N-acetyltransferase [Niallia sp. 03190]|uniref:GNAT family N-acetyltransferase n=1 Tax=Niallia sp. 03190 TaxID=3458061 RepID=UPI004044ED0F